MIQIKEEMLQNWKDRLDHLTATLNSTIQEIKGKKTDPMSPIQYVKMVGEESMLRSILSQISLSAADDINNQ